MATLHQSCYWRKKGLGDAPAREELRMAILSNVMVDALLENQRIDMGDTQVEEIGERP